MKTAPGQHRACVRARQVAEMSRGRDGVGREKRRQWDGHADAWDGAKGDITTTTSELWHIHIGGTDDDSGWCKRCVGQVAGWQKGS
jgi:hypothetical protein